MQSPAERMLELTSDERSAIVQRLGEDRARDLMRSWQFWARPEQLAPLGHWRWWDLITGRGFGKTRAGAEWVLDRARDLHALGLTRHNVGLISRSYTDARDIMIEGESGLMECAARRGMNLVVHRTLPARVEMPDLGVRMTTFSSDQPNKLRGPNLHTVWGDEPSAWLGTLSMEAENAYTMADLALRLPPDPRGVLTMTPKPIPLVRSFVAAYARDPLGSIRVTTGSTFDNAAHLSPDFLDALSERYRGSRLAAQEIDGLLIDESEDALWRLAVIEAYRVVFAPALRTVVAVDPPAELVAECGIVVVGVPKDQQLRRDAYVVEDASLRGSPEEWAATVVDAFRRHDADAVVVEVNNGGDMVRAVIHAVDPSVRVDKVRASEGKHTRAEPVATLYQRGRVHHVGHFGMLEAQMITWVPGDKSPDRLDALVWGVSALASDLLAVPARITSPASMRIR